MRSPIDFRSRWIVDPWQTSNRCCGLGLIQMPNDQMGFLLSQLL